MSSDSSATVTSLYSDHHGWLYKWLCGKLGNSFDAADLAHDTFLRVLAQRRADLAVREPRGYLATIARGLMVDRFRRQAVEQAYLDALALQAEATALSAEAHALLVELLVAIDALLHKLGSRTREIFLLAQLEGLTQAEIAQQTGVSLPTVRKHLVRAYTECLQLAAA